MPGSNCAVEQIPALSQALMSDDPQARKTRKRFEDVEILKKICEDTFCIFLLTCEMTLRNVFT